MSCLSESNKNCHYYASRTECLDILFEKYMNEDYQNNYKYMMCNSFSHYFSHWSYILQHCQPLAIPQASRWISIAPSPNRRIQTWYKVEIAPKISLWKMVTSLVKECDSCICRPKTVFWRNQHTSKNYVTIQVFERFHNIGNHKQCRDFLKSCRPNVF